MDQDTLRFLLREAVTEVLPRRLETTFGQVDLKVPRDREGQYYPAFLKPYARRLVDVGGQPKATFQWP